MYLHVYLYLHLVIFIIVLSKHKLSAYTLPGYTFTNQLDQISLASSHKPQLGDDFCYYLIKKMSERALQR